MLHYFAYVLANMALFYAVAFAVFTTAEIFAPAERMSVRERSRGLGFVVAFALVDTTVVVGVDALVEAVGIRPLFIFRPDVGSAIVGAVLVALWADFCFYWFHRLQHRLLWRWHAVHHSIRHLSAINAYHHWTEPLWRTLFVGAPLLLFDVRPAPTLAALVLVFRLQQFYIHSPSRLQLGPLRRLLVDARYHRIHHSLEAQHHDRNFGAMTPLWDWLFGTLYVPGRDEWPAVGLAAIEEPQTLRQWSNLPRRLRNGDEVGRRVGRPGQAGDAGAAAEARSSAG